MPEDKIDEMFKGVDFNNNDQITYSEFLALRMD